MMMFAEHRFRRNCSAGADRPLLADPRSSRATGIGGLSKVTDGLKSTLSRRSILRKLPLDARSCMGVTQLSAYLDSAMTASLDPHRTVR
jgi:hypothetical protein